MNLNKTFIPLIVSIFILFITLYSFNKPRNSRDCDYAKSYGDDAYTYFKKSYNSSKLYDAQYYAKRGMNAASDAEDEASDSDCDCENAEMAASDAYSYGRKAYNSNNISDAQYYARKAMSSASDISDEADYCDDSK